MPIFVISLVEVRPDRNRENHQFPTNYSGAFVNCLSLAETAEQAKQRLNDCLHKDGYTVVSEGKIRDADFDGCDKEILEESYKLSEKEPVWYGDFNCFP